MIFNELLHLPALIALHYLIQIRRCPPLYICELLDRKEWREGGQNMVDPYSLLFFFCLLEVGIYNFYCPRLAKKGCAYFIKFIGLGDVNAPASEITSDNG